jgi:hypothetical protein
MKAVGAAVFLLLEQGGAVLAAGGGTSLEKGGNMWKSTQRVSDCTSNKMLLNIKMGDTTVNYGL